MANLGYTEEQLDNMPERDLKQLSRHEWQRRYETDTDVPEKPCQFCQAGSTPVRTYSSVYGYPCHVHRLPETRPHDHYLVDSER